jgi:hypothetical protein
MLAILLFGTAAETIAQGGSDGIYGRVITDSGVIHEGHLRFGGDEEALWSNYFNGARAGNPWSAYLSREQLQERVPVEFFALTLGSWQREIDLERPFMARFGDIARIDAPGRELRVMLKSGTVVELDRYGADDFADGVRVRNANGVVIDLGEWQIESIEFLSAPAAESSAGALSGTVRTRNGDYSGLIQWDREQCLLGDVLEGVAAGESVSLPFSEIRSIERRSGDGVLVSLVDGTGLMLSDSAEARAGNRGIYVDDARYGRVLVRWGAFERVDFSAGGTGPGYNAFPPGAALTGSVTTRSGTLIAGRLVYDLDESETTETLDAPWRDVDYTIPFGLVESVEIPGPDEGGAGIARIRLHHGEALGLEMAGDLDRRNGGMLVFGDGGQSPQYLPWSEVARIEFDRPTASYPPPAP